VTTDFKIDDRRGKRELGDSRGVAPASLNTDDIVYEKVTPETCFLKASKGRYIIQEDNFSYQGKIIVPQKAEKRPTTGTIVDVGIECTQYDLNDRVVVGIYSGTVVTFKGWDPKKKINLRVCSEDEILARITEKATEVEGIGA
jgi:co-chaperonin GroES (HSP10)